MPRGDARRVRRAAGRPATAPDLRGYHRDRDLPDPDDVPRQRAPCDARLRDDADGDGGRRARRVLQRRRDLARLARWILHGAGVRRPQRHHDDQPLPVPRGAPGRDLRAREEQGGEPCGPELGARGSRERLAPILMTALTTGLALVPLVISGNVPGQEIEYPMAFVILGGLITSTLLNLFVVPSLYLRFGQSRRDSARVAVSG